MIEYTAAYWATTNPVLPLGEFGLDITNGIIKIGNGETKWLDLASNINPKVTPLVNQTFSGQFNLSTNYEVEYNEYITNTTETPTVSSSNLIDSFAAVIMKAGASASLVTTNMGVAWPGNDTFTANKSNFVAVMQKKPDTVSSTGLWYIIKVLN
jgi:hypothetical protein